MIHYSKKFQDKKVNSGSIHIKSVIFICLILLLSTGVFFSMSLFVKKEELKKTQTEIVQNKEIKQDKFDKTVFQNINLAAEAFVVYDAKTGEVIASKNSDKPLPLASMTKVMTAILASKTLPRDSTIKILQKDLEPDGDSKLVAGDSWKRDDLIKYTLTVSSNDGARALARSSGEILTTQEGYDAKVNSFVLYMNNLAKEYDLSTLVFKNESGLDISPSTPSSVGSAFDVAKLYTKAYFEIPELFTLTTESFGTISSLSTTYSAKNTNESASTIPGLAVSKTGFTDLAEGNLGVVIEVAPGTPVTIIVMHSTKEARESDVKELYHLTLESMKQKSNE